MSPLADQSGRTAMHDWYAEHIIARRHCLSSQSIAAVMHCKKNWWVFPTKAPSHSQCEVTPAVLWWDCPTR